MIIKALVPGTHHPCLVCVEATRTWEAVQALGS